MKKLAPVLCLCLISFLVQGQGMFSIGPKIGYNSNTLSTDFDSIKASINNSFQIGAFVRIGKKFYVQPEVNYQMVTSTLDKSLGTSILQQDITVKTIKVPLIIGVKLINPGRFNLRLLAGPAVSFLIDKEMNPSDMGDMWPIQSVDDLKNSVWSAQMGAGVDVLFLTLDVRYEIGLENIYAGSDDLSMKNNIFNVSLGIKIL
jgi:hypothetical protein